MKTIIAGTRTFESDEYYVLLEKAIKESGFQIDHILCGCGRGMDMLGESWAISHNIPVDLHPAEWKTYGNSAGPIRNKEMAKNADALILVWDGKSKGSANMLKQAKEHGLKIYEKVVK